MSGTVKNERINRTYPGIKTHDMELLAVGVQDNQGQQGHTNSAAYTPVYFTISSQF